MSPKLAVQVQGVLHLREERWQYGLIQDTAGYKEEILQRQVKSVEYK